MTILTRYKYTKTTNLCNLHNSKYSNANPSILFVDDTLFVNFRCIDYIAYISKNKKYEKNINGWLSKDVLKSNNSISSILNGNIDKEFRNLQLPVKNKARFNGLEDGILVQWYDKIYLCGTRCDVILNKGIFCIYELNKSFEIQKEIIIKDDSLDDIEKHWSPVEDMPFTFIRWCSPTELITIDPEIGKIIKKEYRDSANFGKYAYRGNCQTVKYKDGYLSIVHNTQRYFNKNSANFPSYKHYFIQYDNDFNILRISKPFNFEVNDIEFCCGLQIKDNKVYVSYSVYDSIPMLVEFDENVLTYLFDGKEDEYEEITVNDIYERGNELLKNSHFFAAASCYSRVFSDTEDKELEYQSLMRFCVCLLALKYENVNMFSDNIISSFLDDLLLLNDTKAEPYYLYAIYYGLMKDLNKKEFFRRQSIKYNFELPEIKRYLKMW